MNDLSIRPWFLRPSGILMLLFLGALAYIFFGLPDPQQRQQQALAVPTISDEEKRIVLAATGKGETKTKVLAESGKWQLHVAELDKKKSRVIRLVGEVPREPRPIDLLCRFDNPGELTAKSNNEFGDAWSTRLADVKWQLAPK